MRGNDSFKFNLGGNHNVFLHFMKIRAGFVMPRDYSWLHRKLYHTMLADPDGPAWISSKNDSIQCRQHTMDVWDVIAEESRRETKVMDRGVSFPWAMIRFLSISKGSSACVLICTQCTISIGTRLHISGLYFAWKLSAMHFLRVFTWIWMYIRVGMGRGLLGFMDVST